MSLVFHNNVQESSILGVRWLDVILWVEYKIKNNDFGRQIANIVKTGFYLNLKAFAIDPESATRSSSSLSSNIGARAPLKLIDSSQTESKGLEQSKPAVPSQSFGKFLGV